jgi:hypothetical protein
MNGKKKAMTPRGEPLQKFASPAATIYKAEINGKSNYS